MLQPFKSTSRYKAASLQRSWSSLVRFVPFKSSIFIIPADSFEDSMN